MTPDVVRLRASLDALAGLMTELELTLVDDPAWSEPSDTSYLNEKDRTNPDLVANVEAMTATHALISWFGRYREGFVGLWRGPNATALDQAPIVRLDSEGQYELVATTVGDFLAIAADQDRFAEHRRSLVDAGFTVAASRKLIWQTLDTLDDPNAYRHELYNAARGRRGLPPISD
ncbi:MAG: hypothetical protein ABI867_08770 [Kofleriaceae bacterium]